METQRQLLDEAGGGAEEHVKLRPPSHVWAQNHRVCRCDVRYLRAQKCCRNADVAACGAGEHAGRVPGQTRRWDVLTVKS